MPNSKKKSAKKTNRTHAMDPSIFSRLSPQQLAVIAGILTNSLTVDSILVDKDQRLQIVLGGSLRRTTKIDRLVKELSQMNFGEVLDSFLNR